ncbi:MAG TPA: pectin acetylesterase-family hydrolase [Polyangia bacterium]|nr:pectin acetylesterase-family hydrolase [Polyangia bacterium]
MTGLWQKVELPGTVCGNGSQYKFFVNYAPSSNNLIVTFEGGGACWDYDSCSGNGGARGAANPNGIPDDHMVKLEFLPLNRRDASNPLGDWNMVFLPYCTGDLHSGNREATYPNPDPNGAPLVFQHRGHDNMVRVIQWLAGNFPTVPRMLVTGYSAGGSGALINYHYIRKGMTGVQCSYLLDDSGPIFPSGGYSGPLHQKVREAWNLDPLIDGVAPDFSRFDPAAIKADLGLITTALADKYPRDRLATALFRLDFDFSLYSYERFYNHPPQAEIHRMWWEDIQLLLGQYASRTNLASFIPYYRYDNCSHCLIIPPIDSGVLAILGEPYSGTEIQERMVDMRDFVRLLVDDSRKLESFLESVQPGEGLSPERAAQCEVL